MPRRSEPRFTGGRPEAVSWVAAKAAGHPDYLALWEKYLSHEASTPTRPSAPHSALPSAQTFPFCSTSAVEVPAIFLASVVV